MKKLFIPGNETSSVAVYLLRDNNTDEEICEAIGITKATLYSRLRDVSPWKKSERFLIKFL